MLSGIITILGFDSDSEQETCLYLFELYAVKFDVIVLLEC